MQWKFSGKQNVYLEIARQYREYIGLGILKAGDKLPSVRYAATEMGVNPNTVARAYAILEEEGYVVSLPKKGIYVSDRSHAQKKEPFAEEKKLLAGLRDGGVSREQLLKLIEEVYEDHD